MTTFKLIKIIISNYSNNRFDDNHLNLNFRHPVLCNILVYHIDVSPCFGMYLAGNENKMLCFYKDDEGICPEDPEKLLGICCGHV